MSNALYELGVCLPAEILDELPALLAVIGGDADLHQLVLVEGDAGLISISSPIARALIGKSEGAQVTVDAPGGVREYEIISITYV